MKNNQQKLTPQSAADKVKKNLFQWVRSKKEKK